MKRTATPESFAWGRIVGLVALAVVGSAVAFLLWISPGIESARDEERIAVRVSVSRDVATALVHVALAKGYFSDAGLDVEAIEYPSGKRSLEGLFAGEVDFATPAETPLVISSFNRVDFRIVTSIADTGTYQRIVARRDRGVARPADLRGKRIATQKGSAVHYFLHLFLLKHGLSTRDVHLSFRPAEELAPALARGEIDAFSMREPYVTEARRLLGASAVIFEEPGIYQRFDLLVVREELLRENPEAVRRVLVALNRAEDFVRREPDAAVAIVTARLRIPKAAVAADWAEFGFRLALPQALLVNLDEQARWALVNGLIDPGPVPNYLGLVHLDSLLTVKPSAVTVIH